MAKCPACAAPLSAADVNGRTCTHCGSALQVIDGDTGELILSVVTGVDGRLEQMSQTLERGIAVGNGPSSERRIVLGRVVSGQHEGATLIWDGSLPEGQRFALKTDGIFSPISDKVESDLLWEDRVEFASLREAHYVCSACGLRYHPTRSALVTCVPECPRCVVDRWKDEIAAPLWRREDEKYSKAQSELRTAETTQEWQKSQEPPISLVVVAAAAPVLSGCLTASVVGIWAITAVIQLADGRPLSALLLVTAWLGYGTAVYSRQYAAWSKQYSASKVRAEAAERKMERAQRLIATRKAERERDMQSLDGVRSMVTSVAESPLPKAQDRWQWVLDLGWVRLGPKEADVFEAVDLAGRGGSLTVTRLAEETGWTRIRARQAHGYLVEAGVLSPKDGNPWVLDGDRAARLKAGGAAR